MKRTETPEKENDYEQRKIKNGLLLQPHTMYTGTYTEDWVILKEEVGSICFVNP